MSGEVEMYQGSAVVPAASFDLQQWGRDAQLVASVAENLVKTSFVPASYSGRTLEATAAILTGQEIGLKPMASLRSIDVIHGTPAMRAIALRALVQAAGHEIWTEESTRTRAIVAGRRRGSDQVERSEWTLDRARDLQLLGKDNWKKQPIAMLLARATSECARLIAADVLLGVPYSTEELQDMAPVEESDAKPKAPASRTARRKPLPVKPDEPPLPEEAGDVLREADEQDAHQNESLPANGSGSREVAAGSVEAGPAFDDALAQQIEAQVAAERAAEFTEPPLDGVWDETQGSK
jgi:hypothetical protein